MDKRIKEVKKIIDSNNIEKEVKRFLNLLEEATQPLPDNYSNDQTFNNIITIYDNNYLVTGYYSNKIIKDHIQGVIDYSKVLYRPDYDLNNKIDIVNYLIGIVYSDITADDYIQYGDIDILEDFKNIWIKEVSGELPNINKELQEIVEEIKRL